MNPDYPPQNKPEREAIESSPVDVVLRNIKTRQERAFHIEEGETEEIIRQRSELLVLLAPQLPKIAEKTCSRFRAVLDEQGITEEQTGKMTCLLVGGNVHMEGPLHSGSDFDTVLAFERPFSPYRLKHQDQNGVALPEAISTEEFSEATEKLWGFIKEEMFPELNGYLSSVLGEPVDIGVRESAHGGILEVKGLGVQNPEDVSDSIVLYKEV